MSRFRRKRSRTRSSCGPRLDWGDCDTVWARRRRDDEILITSLQLGRSRSDMSYDVAGLGLGGEKKKGKRKMYLYAGVVFFFSSRRRHTRFDCDWSSDVCSSD